MDTASATPKDQLRRVIDEQPDDSSFEEILKELAFAAMIERGLADSRAGRTISHEEMRKTIESWRK
jgi:predicted transcriptional regulator